MRIKYDLQRAFANVQGSCQWYAAACVNNPGNYRTMLQQVYHSTPALQPLMTFIDKKAPGKPKNLQVSKYAMTGTILTWEAPRAKKELDRARQFVVYLFNKGEKIDLEDAEHIVAITSANTLTLPSVPNGSTFIVTALDRLHNESKPVKVKL